MRFRPYAKMPSAGEVREQPVPGGTWVALEKIHGAQLVLAVHGAEVSFGKRKAWLAEEDPFFGWQLLRVQLSAGARSLASKVCEPGGTVYLYGELFGGHYPHPEVPVVPGLSPVQTGIWYAPDLRWSPFDILVARSEEDEGVLLAHSEVEELARHEGWVPPPVVRRGTRSEMGGVPTRMQTRIPSLLGLPAIQGNVAEGLVIKSDQRLPWAQRTAFKRKIEEFNEARFDESEAWDPQRRLSLAELTLWAERLINPARIASAVSKWGWGDRNNLLDEVMLDVRVDLELAFPLAYRSLDTVQEEQLEARIRQCALPLLQEVPSTNRRQGER
ncbi:RNA editing ligase [Cystobacter fuscus DSM 2262]|uniref:RNA editing ligase n=1 Tax=Cystobacter fuscus (strain ATCC 25194 / DSM 2262 / NBRC 100088 / M29) TaxID=1242864 RepID=S9QUX7_CYSF2|nr:RNA ligase family protein [Cystobacter fuscus]EPX60473.1 RNA editing ligase [Cystobacter fuscus DSM 2262]